MTTTVLTESGIAESEQRNVLSEESEREILEMVEEQLERPNPPGTKVLYRRAMHFIDRDVRHLSLQQFNAKFPLQVKRRKARERPERRTARPDPEGRGAAVPGDDPRKRSREPGARENGAPGSTGDGRAAGPSGDVEELRGRLRAALLEYAELVAGAESRADLVEVVPRVDEYVDRVMEEG